jgi:hypothetical protein
MTLLPVPGDCWTVRAFREHQERFGSVLDYGLLQALRQHDDVEFVAIEARRFDAHHRVCEVGIIRPGVPQGLTVSA